MMEANFVCSHAKRAFFPHLLVSSKPSPPSFLLLSFPIHLKPSPFLARKALLYYRLMTIFPLLHLPHFSPPVLPRVVDVPIRYLQKNISSSIHFISFVELRLFPLPVACMPPSPRPSFVHLCRFFFLFLSSTYEYLILFFISVRHPPCLPVVAFFFHYTARLT